MSTAKDIAKMWLPPVVANWIRKRRKEGLHFSGPYAFWDQAESQSTGYDSEEILSKVLDATLKVKQGEAVFERDSVLFYHIEYVWPIVAGLLWTTARSEGKLNVLDFGGALGSSYFQHRGFLQTLPEVRWNIVEQSHYVNIGIKYIQDDCLRFYHTIEDCLAVNQPSIILLSSVLSYLPKPDNIILELKSIGADIIIFDRTIINLSTAHEVYVQHVPASIYAATYPCWSLSETVLVRSMENEYDLISNFPSLEFPVLATIGAEFKGYIFRRSL